MNTEAAYDLIERYLNDTLSADEKSAVETQLKNDISFYNEVAAHRAANEIIVDNALLDVKKELRKIHTENFPKPNYRKFYYGLGALAVGALLIGILFLNRDSKSEKQVNYVEQKTVKNDLSPSKSDTIKSESGNEQKIVKANKNEYVSVTSGAKQEKIIAEFPIKSSSEPNVNTEESKKLLNEQNNKSEKDLINKIIENKNSKDNKENLELTNEANPRISPCDASMLKLDFSTFNSCEGQKNGILIFNDQTLRGTPPYKFSIDGGNTFHSSNQFNNQGPGNYLLVVMDQQNCKSEPVEAQVEKNSCNYIVVPQQQKYWDVPLERFEGQQVLLKIMNGRTGKIVYQKRLSPTNSYTWMGVDDNNNPLAIGAYVYELSSAGSSLMVTGQITIVQ